MRQRDLVGVLVSHRESIERAVFFEYVYNAPVGEVWYRKVCHAGKGGRVIERGGECCSDLCQEALRLLDSLALCDVLCDGDEVARLAQRRAHQRDRKVDPHDRAVLAKVALLSRVGLYLPGQQPAGAL